MLHDRIIAYALHEFKITDKICQFLWAKIVISVIKHKVLLKCLKYHIVMVVKLVCVHNADPKSDSGFQVLLKGNGQLPPTPLSH